MKVVSTDIFKEEKMAVSTFEWQISINCGFLMLSTLLSTSDDGLPLEVWISNGKCCGDVVGGGSQILLNTSLRSFI